MTSASPKKRSQTPKKFAAIEPQENSEFKVEDLKRPKNAYVFFCTVTSLELKKANPDTPQKMIMT
jgi:hypothetical protein